MTTRLLTFFFLTIRIGEAQWLLEGTSIPRLKSLWTLASMTSLLALDLHIGRMWIGAKVTVSIWWVTSSAHPKSWSSVAKMTQYFLNKAAVCFLSSGSRDKRSTSGVLRCTATSGSSDSPISSKLLKSEKPVTSSMSIKCMNPTIWSFLTAIVVLCRLARSTLIFWWPVMIIHGAIHGLVRALSQGSRILLYSLFGIFRVRPVSMIVWWPEGMLHALFAQKRIHLCSNSWESCFFVCVP